jgi:glycosyltransferase involved in cell wall biosynthesis
LKILIISDFFPNKYKPYEAVFCLNHSKVLKRIGNVRVQTLIRVNHLKFSYEKWEIEDIEAEAFVFFYKYGLGFIFLPIAIILQFILTLKNFVFYRPHIVILQMALPQGLAVIPFRIFKRYVVLEHSEKVLSGINKFLAKLVYKFSSGVYVVSSFQKEEIEKKLKIKVNGIIPNPIFKNNFQIKNEIKNRVIFVGTITERKDPILILETAKILKDIKFVFIGRNFNDQYFKNFIQIAKSLENVSYLGALKNEQVLEEMLNSDFLISTSKYETFGMVITEALSLGKPVIWTDSGGPRDFLNKRNSVLVKERTPDALAKAILEAYEKLRNGYFNPYKIREEIYNFCSDEKVLERYINYIFNK